MRPFKISAHDLPEAKAHTRAMGRALRQLTARHSAISGARFTLGRCGAGFEAHLELLLPQHQVIVNSASRAPAGAMHDVMARALAGLAQVELRDPSIRPPAEAKAA